MSNKPSYHGRWLLFSILLLLLINLLRAKKTAPVEATVEDAPEEDDTKPEKKPKKKEEKTVQAHKPKSNECRMTPDNKVIAHSVKRNWCAVKQCHSSFHAHSVQRRLES